MKTKTAVLNGKPDAGKPHVRFDEGEVASAEPRRGSLLYNKLLITGCLLATAVAAVAMPTKKELAAAQKLVEDVIAPDVKALNAGRKTVKDVADIQMKLAADAQSEAEKYLLLQSAFKLYSRGEEFDSAAKALTSITRDIKDIPPELVTELVDKEFNRDIGLRAPREVEMAERAAQSQRLMVMQKELEKTRSARPVLGGLKRQGLLGGTLCARRLQRQQEAQAAMQLKATVDGYTWSYRVNNGEAEIVSENSGKFSCAVSPAPTGNLTIPSTLNGVNVTSIGCEAFKECGEMLSVTMPDSVTNIKGSAFRRCGRLALLSLPQSLRCIGGCAFQDCTNLTSMVIPPHVGDIGGRAFQGCSAMTEVMIPESVTNIARIAFLGCSSLTSVTIPSNVRSIGDWAFKGCNGLTSVKISQGLTTLGPHVFHGCSKLESVMIPSNVVDIAWCAFYECGGLKAVTISPCVTNIGGWAFGRCGGLTSVTIPEHVTNIGGNAFRECTNLTSVTMCGECPTVPNNVFGGCTKLKSIHVPAKAKSWAGMKEWQGIPLVFDAK